VDVRKRLGQRKYSMLRYCAVGVSRVFFSEQLWLGSTAAVERVLRGTARHRTEQSSAKKLRGGYPTAYPTRYTGGIRLAPFLRVALLGRTNGTTHRDVPFVRPFFWSQGEESTR
jgi:hypothetical protein